MGGRLSRRGFLAGAATLLAAGEALPRIGGDLPEGAPDLAVPRENLDAVLRVTGSLVEEDVPCTEVHLMMELALRDPDGDGPDLPLAATLRLKTKKACDTLIACLERHRDDVFSA